MAGEQLLHGAGPVKVHQLTFGGHGIELPGGGRSVLDVAAQTGFTVRRCSWEIDLAGTQRRLPRCLWPGRSAYRPATLLNDDVDGFLPSGENTDRALKPL